MPRRVASSLTQGIEEDADHQGDEDGPELELGELERCLDTPMAGRRDTFLSPLSLGDVFGWLRRGVGMERRGGRSYGWFVFLLRGVEGGG